MSPDVPPSAALPPPSNGRYKVLALLCVMALILYVDRVGISMALGAIGEDLDISQANMGYVVSAFTLAYCLFEVPIGRWGDRYGSRGVLARIVWCWSIFTALTGAALGLWTLLLVRFLFGASESGAFPNTARILARWFPADRRGPAQGLINTTALIGGALAPPAVGYLIQAVGWRWAFVLLSVPGYVWAVVFFRWYRDDPASHPDVNEAERRLIGHRTALGGANHPPIPWRQVLTSANVWLLGGVIACAAFNSYLYFTWYPTYLQKARGVDETTSGWLAGMVLAGAAVGATLGGFLSDTLIRLTGNRRNCRRGIGCGAMASGGILMLIGLHTDGPVLAAIWTALAVLATHLMMSTWWGAVADISGRNLGALFGLLNSLGGLGAISSPIFLGHFTDWMSVLGHTGRAQWDPAFYVYAAILFLGALGWLGVDTSRPVEPVKAER